MDHQTKALDRSAAFLDLPKGAEYGIAYSENGDGREEAGHKIDDFFEVIAATGTGKTRMMGCLAKACDEPTLFLTPRNVINKQIKQEFCEEIGLNPADVGVYDSKQKSRAAKMQALKQKYLITTYQSLPSLLRQYGFSDTTSEHYRPLVLLDEAHMAKGTETAKAIKKLLRKCIVAGFTATEAGEREQLFEGQPPIFNLKIVPAIERDLLCEGVRTGVIDVNIDEQWLKDFTPPASGQDYKEEDILKFVNNPAVIKGAIDFHFNETPDHLRQLNMGGPLHRFPTIFYTQGVEAARKGAELFNKTSIALGKLARADYISGKMSQTERDTKLEQFRTGHLSALWNDSVLEMGFNDKNATIGYMLRPSRVRHRVEQPLGRFARKPTDDYAEKYYPDGFRQGKIALAINVRAPSMNPILFGEILDGRAAVYSQSRPQKPRPKEPTKSIPWADGIAVHIDYDDVNEVVALAQKERGNVKKAEDVPADDWLSATFLRKDYIGGHRLLDEKIRNFAEAKKAFFTQQGMEGSDAAALVAAKWAGWYKGRGKWPAWHIAPQGVEELVASGELKPRTEKAPPAPTDWVNITTLYAEYTGSELKFAKIIEELILTKETELLDQNNGITADMASEIVKARWAGWYSGHDKQKTEGWHISPEARAELIAQGKLKLSETKAPDAKPGWKSANTISDDYVGSTGDLNDKFAAYAIVKTQVLMGERNLEQPEAAKEVYEKFAGRYTKGGNESWHLSEEAVKELVASGTLVLRSERAPKVPANWLPVKKLIKMYGSRKDVIERNIQTYIPIKANEIALERQVTAAVAAQEVFDYWAGWYTGTMGHEAWHISQLAADDMVARGLLGGRRRKVSPAAMTSDAEAPGDDVRGNLKAKRHGLSISPAHLTDAERAAQKNTHTERQ